MVLPKIYTHNTRRASSSGGFTLIEVIIVVAILSVFVGSSMFFSTHQLRRESLLSERRQLVSALQIARARAMNNVEQITHGVALYPPGVAGYVIFSGTDYTSRIQATDVILLTDYPVTFASDTPPEIVFQQLSGEANYDGEIILHDERKHSSTSIRINYEGKIGW